MKTYRYIATRRCEDHKKEYVFYMETEQIGTAFTCNSPVYGILIKCNGNFLKYVEASDREFGFPKEFRIYDGKNGEIYSCIMQTEKDAFRMETPFGEYQAEIQEEFLVFGQDDIGISGVSNIQKGSFYDLTQDDFKDPQWELFMAMESKQIYPAELAVLMMTFRLMLWHK